VLAFQTSRGLPADGVVGRATWSALAGQQVTPAPKPAPVLVVTPAKAPAPPSAAPTPSAVGLMAYAGTTLRQGSRGEAVRALQYRLRLPLVGTFGPATKTAVIAFQTSRGLTPDGVVGRATWAALAK
jgi:peptidoglycan hydrolase-like protein with peptidoglycan-binding domain